MDNIQAIINVMKDKLIEKLGDEIELIFLYGSYLKGTTHKY